jgi:hypothetical protein
MTFKSREQMRLWQLVLHYGSVGGLVLAIWVMA